MARQQKFRIFSSDAEQREADKGIVSVGAFETSVARKPVREFPFNSRVLVEPKTPFHFCAKDGPWWNLGVVKDETRVQRDKRTTVTFTPLKTKRIEGSSLALLLDDCPKEIQEAIENMQLPDLLAKRGVVANFSSEDPSQEELLVTDSLEESPPGNLGGPTIMSPPTLTKSHSSSPPKTTAAASTVAAVAPTKLASSGPSLVGDVRKPIASYKRVRTDSDPGENGARKRSRLNPPDTDGASASSSSRVLVEFSTLTKELEAEIKAKCAKVESKVAQCQEHIAALEAKHQPPLHEQTAKVRAALASLGATEHERAFFLLSQELDEILEAWHVISVQITTGQSRLENLIHERDLLQLEQKRLACLSSIAQSPEMSDPVKLDSLHAHWDLSNAPTHDAMDVDGAAATDGAQSSKPRSPGY